MKTLKTACFLILVLIVFGVAGNQDYADKLESPGPCAWLSTVEK